MACDGHAWLRTEFQYPDGKIGTVHAHPNHDPHSVNLAEELGYEDVQRMTYEHDFTHMLLAHKLLNEPSPVLLAVAEDRWEEMDMNLAALEEAAVMAIQRWHNAVKEARNG